MYKCDSICRHVLVAGRNCTLFEPCLLSFVYSAHCNVCGFIFAKGHAHLFHASTPSVCGCLISLHFPLLACDPIFSDLLLAYLRLFSFHLTDMRCRCDSPPSPDCAQCNKPLFHQAAIFYDGRLYHRSCFVCSSCGQPLNEQVNPPVECRVANRLVCSSCRSADLQAAACDHSAHDCPHCSTRVSSNLSSRSRPRCQQSCEQTSFSATHSNSSCSFDSSDTVVSSSSPSAHSLCPHTKPNQDQSSRPVAAANCVSPNIARIINKLQLNHFGRRSRSSDCTQSSTFLSRPYGSYGRRSRSLSRLTRTPQSPTLCGRCFPPFCSPSSTVICICKCCRCGQPVYANERVWSLERAWHRYCLACVLCGATLSPGMHSVAPDGRPICNIPCSNRLYGSARYGFGCHEKHT